MGRRVCAAAVLQALAESGADLPGQRRIHRQRLVEPLEHGDAALALQRARQQIGGKRPEHHQVEHPHLEMAVLAQMIGDRFRGGDQAALAQQHVVGVFEAVAEHARVAAAGEGCELGESLVRQRRDVVEEERPLRGHALHVAVLILHHPGHDRVVDVPQFRHPPPGVAEQHLLRRRRTGDHIFRPAEILGDQLALRRQQRFHQMGGEKPVLGDDAGIQRKLRGAVSDEVQVRGMLGVLGEQLKEAGVIDAMIVVVSGVDVQGCLGHGPATHVEHVGQPFAHRRVQGLVHVGDALPGGEVGRPQPGHGQAGGDRGGGVLAFRLDEDQRPAGDVQLACRGSRGPFLAHLGGWRDRVRAGGIAGGAFAGDHRAVAVQRGSDAGILHQPFRSVHRVILSLASSGQSPVVAADRSGAPV